MNQVQEHIEKVRADASQKYSNFSANTRGFADQSMGLIPSLNANDMISSVYNNGKDFIPKDNFVSNCKGCDGTYKNLDLSDIGGILTKAGDIYTAQQKAEAEKAQAAAAAQIEADKVKQQQAQIELEKIKAASDASKGGSASKIIITVGIVVGVVGILGIASYFFFKKKKIS